MNYTRVINIRSGKPPLGKAIYIGRNGKWGNPFVTGKRVAVRSTIGHVLVANQEAAVSFYWQWLQRKVKLVGSQWRPTREAIVSELHGAILMCFCVPKLCHGHVLAAIADGILGTPNAVEGSPCELGNDARTVLADGYLR